MNVLITALLFASLTARAEAVSSPEAGTPAAASSAPAQVGTMDEVLKLRDPFKRPDIELSKGPPKTPLEMYNLDAFKMVAVLTGPKKLRAMLKASDGTSFIVERGDKIGRRNGVISQIEDDLVRVRERIINVLGKEENVDTEIPLASDGKGQLVIRAANE